MRAKLAAVALAVLALTGCASANGGGGTPAPVGDDLDGSWLLTAATDSSGAIDLGSASITLEIEQSVASGNSGCNSYTGEFSAKAEGVSFGPLASTRMACSPSSVMTLEARYLKALEATTTAAVAHKTLTLTGSGPLQLTYTEVEPLADAELVGPTWTLESIGTGDGTSSVQGDATLVFGDDGTLRGSAGCRTFTGEFASGADGDISVSNLEIAHSDCSAEIADQETRVLAVIGEHFRATIDADVLTATTTGSDVTLTYRTGTP